MLELEIRGTGGCGKSRLAHLLTARGVRVVSRPDSYDVPDAHVFSVRATSAALTSALHELGAAWKFGSGRRIIATPPPRE